MDRRTDLLRVATLGLVLLAAVAGGIAVGYTLRPAVDASGGSVGASSTAPLLDGTQPLQPEPLAELALARAEMGARWLAEVSRHDGSFFYVYEPEADEYEPADYNEVRHAGTTYAMFQAYGVLGDEAVLAAAEAGARYIDENSPEEGAGRAFVFEGRTKLGGQALALVALLEWRRVLADSTYDPLIDELTAFMLAMELPEEPGRYWQSYDAVADEPSLEPDSDFYPGEALLALTRLAQHFPDGPYLDYAARAADYLIHERDGDIPAEGQVPREDHWLTLALSELYRLQPEPEYLQVAYLQADSMIGNQHDSAETPMRIGASSLRSPINYTSTATKGEALVAAWALAQFAEDAEQADRYAAAARRNIQFQLRVQYTPENTQLFPRPEAAIGAWGESGVDPSVRMDFVQHNVSSLLGVWHVTSEGDIPIAEPID